MEQKNTPNVSPDEGRRALCLEREQREPACEVQDRGEVRCDVEGVFGVYFIPHLA